MILKWFWRLFAKLENTLDHLLNFRGRKINNIKYKEKRYEKIEIDIDDMYWKLSHMA